MARGRKAEPTALKVAKGTRADRVNREEPRLPAARPVRPGHLDEVAAAEWDRIVPELEAAGLLASIDGAALALYCDAFSTWIRANHEVEVYGLLVETGLGGLKANPAVAIARAARAQMHALLSDFGCSPASRCRVKVKGDAKAKDALGEFLGRRKAT